MPADWDAKAAAASMSMVDQIIAAHEEPTWSASDFVVGAGLVPARLAGEPPGPPPYDSDQVAVAYKEDPLWPDQKSSQDSEQKVNTVGILC